MPRNHVRFADDEEPEGPHFRGLRQHLQRGILKDPNLDSIRAQRGSSDFANARREERHRQERQQRLEAEMRDIIRERERRAREEERRRRLERELDLQRERQRLREADLIRERERERERRRQHEREIRRLQQEREERLYEDRHRRDRIDVVEFVSRDALENRIREERRRRDRIRNVVHEARLLDHHGHERVRVRRYGGGM